MPLLSMIRSLSQGRLHINSTNTSEPNAQTSPRSVSERQHQPRPSCEQRASIMRECVAHSISMNMGGEGILLPPPVNETHRRANRRQRKRHISFDATTEAHQHFKSLGYPRIPAFQVEEPRKPYVPRPAHWSRSYHLLYEGAEGPIIQDAMYTSLMQVLLPEPQQAPCIAPVAPVLPSVESFATIKHHAMNDAFSLETFTPSPSPPSTPRASPRRAAPAGPTPRRSPGLFFPSLLSDSPRPKPSPDRAAQDTPTRKSPTFKRLVDSVSMQAVMGMSLSVSSSFDSTANFALGLLVGSESGNTVPKWDSIQDLNSRMEERRRTQTAGF